jgi:aquaporin Z
MNADTPTRRQLFLAELCGTGLLVLIGLSSVIFMFAEGSPFVAMVPSLTLRRVINGFFFGAVGATIALSPLGRISGAHINPVVTMGFWLMGKLTGRSAIGYCIAQLLGALLGSLPLVLWGQMGRGFNYAVTVPGKGYSIPVVILGEVATTFCLIAYLCVFLAFNRLRKYTPFFIPVLFAIMVPLEAGISGISVNPARSFGPSVISGVWTGWWIYWVGPLIGGLLAILLCNKLAKRIEVAKLYYFDSDPDGRFRRVQRAPSAPPESEKLT